MLGIGNFQAVLIESGQCADYAHHHRHWVCITAETTEKPCELLMHHGVMHHGVDKLLFLFGGRQLAVNQQVAGFQIIALFRQLLDRIAAIVQIAFIAVDKGYFRFAACGGNESRVEGEHSAGFGKRADVHHIVTQFALQNRQFEHFFACDFYFNGLGHLLTPLFFSNQSGGFQTASFNSV